MKLYVLAGEPSGDQLAGPLLAALKERFGEALQLRGVGGEEMELQGLQSLYDLNDFAVMGIVEVVRHLPRLRRHINNLVADIEAWKPDILLSVDSPGLCFRIAHQIKTDSICKIHYVAPSVWAWKPERAQKIAGFLDGLLTVLPFEPPYFTPHGLDTRFVGHSLLERGAACVPLALAHSQQNLLLAPGSRVNEIKRMLPLYLKVSKELRKRFKDIKIIIPTVANVEALVRSMTKGLDVQVVTGSKARWEAFARADAALVTSGTVALELACLGVPTVVGYIMNPLSAWYVRRKLRLERVSLPNILLKRDVFPELLMRDCTQEKILDQLVPMLETLEARERMQKESAQLRAMLSPPSPYPLPSEAAASMMLDIFNAKRAGVKNI